ncbi:hypothetical protein [Cohnella sp. WQ 127256]|uniref:hypothetical protein n=1 Tax=Cohnella sp. WQ 127256 TaxID=2938790 RepID=UPI002117AB8D|nr:hypothetical protein [Cohnella sp. WQ 127256]
MELSKKTDLIINGVSTAGGGVYEKVKIDGIGTVEGNLTSSTLDANGITKIKGDLQTGALDGDGILKIFGNLSAGKTLMDGQMSVKGNYRADHLTLNGILNISGNCEIESFEVEGAFEIKGLLNAGRMNVKLQGRGKAHEIGVESMQVRRASRSVWSKLWQWMLPKFTPELQAETIEGDDIDLEFTEARVVRGNRIIIGKGCNIELVEYRTELKAHPSAKIGREVKVGG